MLSLNDLQGKRAGIGALGSGIRYTSDSIAEALNLKLQKDNSGFDTAVRKLSTGQLDATIYIGSIGANPHIRQQLISKPSLQLVPIQPTLINYLINHEPGSY